MPTYNATNWPPLEIPQPESQLEIWAVQASPVPPSPAAPAVTRATVNWQPAAAIPNTTTYYSQIATQVQIDTEFSIINRRLLPATSTSGPAGTTIILSPPSD